MKKLNQKGFTLIELLAVIVILGVIMVIAVPAVTKYITNSRKDSYVSTAKMFIDAARTSAATNDFTLPVATNEATVISVKNLKLSKGGTTSTFGSAWNYAYTFVAIVNTGTVADPVYKYYFQGVDAKGNYIALTEENDLTRASVDKEAGLATASISTYTGALAIFGFTSTAYIPVAAVRPTFTINAVNYTTLTIYYTV